MLGIAKRTIGQIGLELDGKKTNIYRRGRRQIVTGLVVNETVNMPPARSALNCAPRCTWRKTAGQFTGTTSRRVFLPEGRLGFLHSVNPAASFKLRLRLKKVTTNSDD
ncbi:MAG: hypothetical protein IPG64_21270 [Haliea sp.]|nr:hypothetical protein [Haliea sp.]